MGKLSGKNVLTAALALLLIFFSWGPTPGQAAGGPSTYWDNEGTGGWDGSGNWTSGVPTSVTNAILDFPGGTALISTSDAWALNLIAGQTYVSGTQPPRPCTVLHLDSSLTVAGTLTLGQGATDLFGSWYGSYGKYYMNDSGGGSPSLSADSMIVSDLGYGVFLQQGGTVQVTNDLILGNQILPGDPQDGTYPFSGQYTMWQGATAPSLTVGDQLIVGYYGYGGFEQYSGSVVAPGSTSEGSVALIIGKEADSQGYYSLENDASLTVGRSADSPVTMYVGQAGSGYFSIDYNGGAGGDPYSFKLFGDLVVGDQAGSWGMVEQQSGTATVTGNLTLGNLSGAYGEYDLFAGTKSGSDEWGSYTYTTGPASLNVQGSLILGQSGYGYFTQNGGTVTVGQDLILGQQQYGYGNYYLSEGTFVEEGWSNYTTSPASLNVGGSLIVGQSGNADFTQEGGTVTVNQDLILGQQPSSYGSYYIWEGTDTEEDWYNAAAGPAYLTVGGSLIVGQSGNGGFTQEGGTVTVTRDLILGQQAASNGEYNLRFIVSESGDGEGGPYSYSTSPAYLTVGGSLGGSLIVGQAGSGSFTQEGGTVMVAQDLILGQQAASSGAYSLSGATSSHEDEWGDFYSIATGSAYLSVGGSLGVGQAGTGSFTQEGGTVTVAQDLILGQQAASSGNYSLFGGTKSGEEDGWSYTQTTDPAHLTMGGSLIVGQAGSGSFTQEGGSVAVTQDLILGQQVSSSGDYSLFEGTKSEQGSGWSNSYTTGPAYLTVGGSLGGSLIVGQYGSGTFSQEGGTVLVGQDLVLGQEAYSSGAYTLFEGTGSYQNSGNVSYTTGPAFLNVQGSLIVGDSGIGEFDQNGGSATVGGSLILANGEHHAEGDDGAYYLYNGTLNVLGQGVGEEGGFPAAMIVGAGGWASFYQSNGALTVNGNLIVGDRPDSEGYIAQYGGTATVTGNLILGNNAGVVESSPAYGSYYLGGGEVPPVLDVQGYLIVGNSGHGSFSQDGGSVHVGQDLVLAYQGYDAHGQYDMSGTPDSTILNVDRDLIVGNSDGSGTFNQDGGKVEVGRDLILGNLNYDAYGEYHMSGSPDDTILHVTRDLIVGNISGYGDFYQDNGQVAVGRDLILGNQTSDAYGDYFLYGGSLTVGQEDNPATMYVGKAGDGYFHLGGGEGNPSFTVYGDLVVAEQPGWYGSRVEQFFAMATVTGSVTLGTQPGSSGEYYLYNGSLTVGQEDQPTTMYVGKGGEGYFQIGGGEGGGSPIFTLYGDLVVSDQAGSYGDVIQYGGTAEVLGNLTLGNSGPYITDPDNFLDPASGGYALVDGSLTVGREGSLTSTMVVGVQGAGYFWLGADPNSGTTGNPSFSLNGNLVVADQAGSYGEVYQNNGMSRVWGSLTIGNAGAVIPETGDPVPAAMGVYTLVNGALNVGGVPGADPPQSMIVGKNGNGYFLEGIDPYTGSTGSPTFSLNGELVVGLHAGSVGVVLQGAGQATVNGDLTLGVHGASEDPALPAAMGAYVLGPVTFPESDPLGSDPTLNVTGNISVGYNGLGGFSQTGGTLTAGGVFLGIETAGVGGYVMEGGSLSTPILNVGLKATGGTVQFPTEIETPFGTTLSLQEAAILFPFLRDLPIDLDTGTYTGPGGYFYQTGGDIHTNHVEVGAMPGSRGYYQMSGGSLTITSADAWDGALILGRQGASGSIPAASGTFDLSNTGILNANYIYVGDSGLGTFTQTGGTVTVNNNLVVGNQAGSVGNVYQNGGTALVKGELILGNAGADTTDSDNTIPAAVGKHSVVNGALTVGQQSAPTTVYVGKGGIGELGLGIDLESIGTDNITTGNPTFTLYGNLLVGDQADSYGRMFQFGSTATVTENLTLGNLQGASGDYTLYEGTYANAGGTYTSSPGYLTVGGSLIGGAAGGGGLAQAGGAVTVGQDLILGQQGTSSGYYEMFAGTQSGEEFGQTYTQTNGATYLVVGGSLIAGQYGTGAFSQDGGDVTVNHDLVLGQQASSSGSYALFEGTKPDPELYSYTTGTATLNVRGSLTVGQAGTGSFAQDGGAVNVSSDLILGQQGSSSGNYHLFEGTRVGINTTNPASLIVGGSLIVGQAGTGSFLQEGGSALVGQDLILGQQGSSSGDYHLFEGTRYGGYEGGTYSYTTGPASLTVGGSLIVGQSGEGHFTQEGGQVMVTGVQTDDGLMGGNLILGQGANTSGSYALVEGSGEFTGPYGPFGYATGPAYLAVGGSLIVGQNGQGTFTQSGGSVEVGQELAIGSQAGSSGSYSLDGGGSLTVGQAETPANMYVGQAGSAYFYVDDSANLTLYGNLVVADQAGSNGKVNQYGGSLSATNVNLAQSVGSSGTYNLSGGSLTIGVGGQLRVGRTGSGTFTQTGGSVTFVSSPTTTDYLKVGVNGGTGYYYLSGNAATLTMDGMEIVGYTNAGSGGTGYFYQSGGTNSIVRTTLPANGGDGGRLLLGQGQDTYGYYKLSGGQLLVGGKEILGLSDLGQSGGTGVFVQTGGTNTINGISMPEGDQFGRLVAGWYDNTVGTYELQGGVFRSDRVVLGNDSTIPTNGVPVQPDASGRGTMTISGGDLAVERFVIGWHTDTGNGGFGKLALTSDTAHVEADNFYIGQQGIITAVSGAVINIKDNFQNNSIQNALWNTANAEMKFITGADTSHMLFIAGQGASGVDNFAWYTLDITGQTLYLRDGNATANGDQWLQVLIGATFAAQIEDSNLTNIFNGDPNNVLNLYYDKDLAANAYLGGFDYTITGGAGGHLYAHTPLPPSVLLLGSGLLGLGLLGWRRRRQG